MDQNWLVFKNKYFTTGAPGPHTSRARSGSGPAPVSSGRSTVARPPGPHRTRGAAREPRQLPPAERRFRPKPGGRRFRARGPRAPGVRGAVRSPRPAGSVRVLPGCGHGLACRGPGAGKVLHAPHDCSDPKARPVRMAGPEAPHNTRPQRPLLKAPTEHWRPPFHPTLPQALKTSRPRWTPKPDPRVLRGPRAPSAASARPAPGAEPAGRGPLSWRGGGRAGARCPGFLRPARSLALLLCAPRLLPPLRRPSRLSSWAGRGLHTRRL